MRWNIRKHYAELIRYVELANLGWAELERHDRFPLVGEVKRNGADSPLLGRIQRTLERRFKFVKLPGRLPPPDFPAWGKYRVPVWRQLHAYVLVRRLFDSLDFLVNAQARHLRGCLPVRLALQTERAAKGALVRVRDPYEDFLTALEGLDLSRLDGCPVCKRFFVALRSDQKTCTPRCANRLRVFRFRQKAVEYQANRRFRRRTGLKAVRKNRRVLMQLHQALREVGVPLPAKLRE